MAPSESKATFEILDPSGDAHNIDVHGNRVRQFRDRGKTIVAVSHAAGILMELCDRALYLDQGELVRDGEIRSVLDAYTGIARSATP
jgi:teichoic acid transport system ATP-binding protein